MDHREKVEFILYQMKIMIKKKDIIRLLIVSRKVTEKTFKGQNIEDLRVQYYAYFSVYHIHEQDHLEAANCMKAIVDSLIKNAPELANLPKENEFGFKFDFDIVFSNMIFFTAVAEYSEKRSQLLNEISTTYVSQLEKRPTLLRLVKGLLSKELISTDINSWEISQVQLF